MNGKEKHREINVVILYHDDDEDCCLKLKQHLSSLARRNVVSIWYKKLIVPGSEVEKETTHQIEEAKIVLFLGSASSMDSELRDNELKLVLSQKQKRTLILIGVLVKAFYFKGDELEKFQWLPRNKKPIEDAYWGGRDNPCSEIAEELEQVCINLQQDSKSMTEEGKLNPRFWELENFLIQSPDESVMGHSKYKYYAEYSNIAAHFKIYQENIAKIRASLLERKYNFCSGNAKEINLLLPILHSIKSVTQNFSYIEEIEQCQEDTSELIDLAEDLKLEISDNKFNEYPEMNFAIRRYIIPFCNKLKDFEELCDQIANLSISSHLGPINLN